MEKRVIPAINKDADLSKQLEDALPYASNILVRSLMGLPVNRDNVKDAKFAISNYRGLKILEKENRKVDNAEKRFNFKALDEYGNEESKKKVKALLNKSIGKMKFID